MLRSRIIKLLAVSIVSVTIIASAVGFRAKSTITKAETKDKVVFSTEALDYDYVHQDELQQYKDEKRAAYEQRKLINQQKLNENQQKKQKLEDEIKAYLGSNIDVVGLSYYDIKSGNEITINGDKTFLAASTVKVQMNMVLADLIKSGQISKDEALQYTDDLYEDGTGILQGEDLSSPISLKLLSKYSIVYSDNIATNMIMDRIGYDKMRSLIDSKIGHATDHSDNYITAKDETSLLKLLYENKDNNTLYNELIENMKNTEFHDRMDLYVPQNIVAHKIGNYDNYVNDVGIVYSKNPYILSVYTDEVEDADEVIAHISELIYNYQNSIEE
jgi:beta-lactamase class A